MMFDSKGLLSWDGIFCKRVLLQLNIWITIMNIWIVIKNAKKFPSKISETFVLFKVLNSFLNFNDSFLYVLIFLKNIIF